MPLSFSVCACKIDERIDGTVPEVLQFLKVERNQQPRQRANGEWRFGDLAIWRFGDLASGPRQPRKVNTAILHQRIFETIEKWPTGLLKKIQVKAQSPLPSEHCLYRIEPPEPALPQI
jgi:hypothetical protein